MKRILIICIVIIFPLFIFGQTADIFFKKGRDFYDKKDYITALQNYKKAAEKNHAEAMYEIGTIYYFGGNGVEKNRQEAFKWFEMSANHNYYFGFMKMGDFYKSGEVVEKNYIKAIEWFEKAAKDAVLSSNPYQYIADLYRKGGYGIEKNYRKSIEYYEKSGGDNIHSILGIGELYEEGGYGIDKDFDKAAEYYNKAISRFPKADIAKNALFSLNKKREQASLVEPSKKQQKIEQDKQEAGEEDKNAIQNDMPIMGKSSKLDRQPQAKEQAKLQSQEQIGFNANSELGIDIVDNGIPVVRRVNKNTFAIIVANENYSRETKVDYAKNDGEVFKNYCNRTLGLPEKNVHFIPDATLNDLIGELDWLSQVCKAFKGEASVIFYYAGHGIPDEASGSAYLLPTDGNSRLLRTCFSIKELYEILGSLPAKKVTVLMDACFSGAKRNGGMLASARGVAIRANTGAPKGNMIVLSAATGDETAYKYEDAKHGLFTYFLLKKLKDSKGNVTMGELSRYIQDQVERFSIVENGKSQTPTIQASDALRTSWQGSTLY